jgi:hypothetical protein
MNAKQTRFDEFVKDLNLPPRMYVECMGDCVFLTLDLLEGGCSRFRCTGTEEEQRAQMRGLLFRVLPSR